MLTKIRKVEADLVRTGIIRSRNTGFDLQRLDIIGQWHFLGSRNAIESGNGKIWHMVGTGIGIAAAIRTV